MDLKDYVFTRFDPVQETVTEKHQDIRETDFSRATGKFENCTRSPIENVMAIALKTKFAQNDF